MYKVTTNSCCMNESKVYYGNTIQLVLDTPAYEEAQEIAFFRLNRSITISRVNKVDELPTGLMIIHIA